MKKILKKNGIQIIILLLIFIISGYVSYLLLIRNISLVENNNIIIEKEINNPITVYIGEDEYLIDQNNKNENSNIDKNEEIIDNEDKKLVINQNKKNDYFKLNYKDKEFLLSDDPNSYNFGFITKQLKNNILYIYSHNSYKFTENSGYYLYRNLKLYDTLVFNSTDKYQIYKTKIIDLETEKEDTLQINDDTEIIYFTCTPHGENIRKVYYLSKLK